MAFQERITSAFAAENTRRQGEREKRLTKTDLWRAAKLSSGAVSHWFDGSNGADLAACMKVAPLLRVNPYWLYDGSRPQAEAWGHPGDWRDSRDPLSPTSMEEGRNTDRHPASPAWPFERLTSDRWQQLTINQRRAIEDSAIQQVDAFLGAPTDKSSGEVGAA